MVRRTVALCALLGFFLLTPALALARPPFAASGSFVAATYSPSDTFRYVLTVRTTQPLENADVSFVILAKSNPGKPLFAKYLVNSIAPGTTRFAFSAKAAKIGATDGIYPVVVKVEQGDFAVRIRAKLIVVDAKRHGPLLVALVWNVNEPSAISPKGVFLDDKVAGMVRGGRSPGWLRRYVTELSAHPRIHVSMNLTPRLLEEVLGVAGGYKLMEQKKIVPVRAESTRSADARDFLQSTVRLMRSEQVELVPAPYAYPALGELASRGWRSDIRLQLQHGQDAVERSLRTASTAGIFVPRLTLTSGALPALRRAGVEYTVLKWRPRTDRFGAAAITTGTAGTITCLFNDESSARLLYSRRQPRVVVRSLLTYLAKLRLARGERATVVPVIVSANSRNHLSPALLKQLYSSLEGTRWLRTVTLGEAVRAVSPSSHISLPKRSLDPRLKPYFNSIGRARNSVAIYSSMVKENNPVLTRLTRNLLLAESANWMGGAAGLAQGRRFADDVTRTVGSELAKISAPSTQTITLPGQSGKIALNVTNGTRQPLSVRLLLSGTGVGFPEGRSARLDLKPGDNYVTVPVTLERQAAPVQVLVTAGGATLLRSVIHARTSYFNRMALLVAIMVALVGLLFFVWRKAAGVRRR